MSSGRLSPYPNAGKSSRALDVVSVIAASGLLGNAVIRVHQRNAHHSLKVHMS